jgi:hypothetical protein
MRAKERQDHEFILKECRDGNEPGYVRRGIVGEWRTTLNADDLAEIAPSIEMLPQLG